jgi:hypothetical protein
MFKGVYKQMLIIDGILIGALTGATISGVGGMIIKINSSAPTDIPAGIMYGTTGGAIGGLIGDIVTGNSIVGILTGATVGAGIGLSLLIAKELSTIG